MRGKSLLTGIVTGAVVAGISTLLATPSSGQDFQRTCKKKYASFRESLQRAKEQSLLLKEQVQHTTKVGSEAFKEVSGDVKTSIVSWKKDIDPTIQQLKFDIDNLQKSIEDLKQLKK
ncbi:YtxH domain-containing protein [Halalkalibacterium ligniniphilum]|uniref:YtxH domain-containing protein n=1 Tax=Halalkalibacterium ligniniphilum TaxID=1134413 RepID=UPI0003465FEE|nr:YtxH domain-containing protein [Halalkalibacterium ligniniphilum]